MSAPAGRYDVAVVGARCAGAATAMLLARRGHRVLVLDHARPGSDTLSTHALMRGGAVQLRRWGLLGAVAAAGTPPIRQTRFQYGDESAPVRIKPGAGVDALYAPRRTVLDRILVDAAVAAGAEVRFGVGVTDLERDPDGRVVGLVARDRDLAPVRVRARLTIGADGIRSLVARETGAATLRTGAGSGAVVYGYWAGLDVTGYEWFYRRGATAGFVPTNDGETLVFAGTTTARFRREIAGDVRAGYLRLLKEAVGGSDHRLDDRPAPPRLRAFPGQPGHSRRPWGPGWALVGDAGHFVDPLSTHGMTDAFRDAELLAEAVDAVLAGADEGAALAGYERRRDHLARPMFDAIDRLSGYQWTETTVRSILMEISAGMSAEVEALVALG
jgi:2-polyprenyl-6-methoxyphenol hydroxylase-like FAD-dependent oxidoreductase